MHGHNNHNGSIKPFLRQLGAEQVVLPIGDGVPISWLALQVTLFFIACVVCSCCSISSYAWSNISASIRTPGPTQTVLYTLTANVTEPAKSQSPISTPANPSAPTATSQPSTSAPTPVPIPTTLPTSLPTIPPSPTQTDTSRSSEALSSLYVAQIEHNPPGIEANEDPLAAIEKELVIIRNPRPDDQDMTGWTVNNNQLDTFQFPDNFTLRSGTSVRVWTKSGTNTDTDLYWGSEKELWDNERDVAYLQDHTGTLIDTLDW